MERPPSDAQDVKPYQNHAWALKRVGLTLLATYVALAFAPVLATLGVSNTVVGGYLVVALLLCFAFNWWFLQGRRREKRRRAAIRALRGGGPIERPALVAPRSARQRMSGYALVGGLMVVSLGVPLIVIGGSGHSVAVRDVGLALVVLDVLVVAIVLPGVSARRRRRSGHPTSENPQP